MNRLLARSLRCNHLLCIIIAADAAGFAYLQDGDGQIYSFDTDGGEVKLIATNINDFVCRLIFGPEADKFAGNKWLNDLKAAKLV